jgi:sugar/nucleoside kinase (ribokinase family)
MTVTTSDARSNRGDEKIIRDAGSSTDQYVTGHPETGTFTTDVEPRGDTPIVGSGNVGMNAVDPDREDPLEPDGASNGSSS